MITLLFSGTALGSESFVSVYAVQVHIILLVLSFGAVSIAEKKQKSTKIIQETPTGFLIASAIGVIPVYIFMALQTPLTDLLVEAQMVIYFLNGAAIEEITFRYAMPKLLYSSGYSNLRSQLISNVAFSGVHWFVWDMSPSALMLGAGFGFANAIALQISGSFLGIVWSHACHNLWLAGASGIMLLSVTVTFLIYILMLELIKK